jgi:hypothetical protein
VESYPGFDELRLKERISEPNSVYTHYLLLIIDKLRDEFQKSKDLLEESSKEEYLGLKRKEITALRKSKDVAISDLNQHINKINSDLEEFLNRVEVYDKELEVLLEKKHVIENTEIEEIKKDKSSSFSTRHQIIEEVLKYLLKLISKEELVFQVRKLDEGFDLDLFLDRLSHKGGQSIQINEVKQMSKKSHYDHKKDLETFDKFANDQEKKINSEIHLKNDNKTYTLQMIEDLKQEIERIKSKSSLHDERLEMLDGLIKKKLYEIEFYSPKEDNPAIKTEERRLGQLEVICREKKPHWDEELKTRKIIVEEKGINEILHFTDSKNLASIIQHGLLSRDSIKDNGLNFSPSDMSGPPKLSEYISTSISFPNYKMFYSKRMAERHKEWIILAYSPKVLYNLPCYFTPTNASNKNSSKLSSLISLFNFPELRNNNQINPSYPTDPQAEVLFYKHIRNEFLTFIYCEDQAQKRRLERLYSSSHPIFRVNQDLFKPRNDHSFWAGKDYYSISQEIANGN